MWAYLATIAVVVTQVAAYPTRYVAMGKCEMPTIGYGLHQTPIQDATFAFSVMDGSTPATTYTPGKVYSITLTYPAPGVHYYVLTSAGVLAPGTSTNTVACNGLVITSPNPSPAATSFAFSWTAPSTCSDVKLSVNGAQSPSDTFRQATATLPCAGAASSTGRAVLGAFAVVAALLAVLA